MAQGTLYPDVIESGHGHAGTTANIKLHHNVGGLPEELGFELVEPLRELFKDEVRQVGEVLGLPEQLVWRHPFPGPGLAVRVIGDITPEKLRVLRDADEIVLEELVANNLYRKTAQVFAVLLPIGTVGVMGDARSYDSVIAIRAVESQDFMTADWARIPFDVLATMSNRIHPMRCQGCGGWCTTFRRSHRRRLSGSEKKYCHRCRPMNTDHSRQNLRRGWAMHHFSKSLFGAFRVSDCL